MNELQTKVDELQTLLAVKESEHCAAVEAMATAHEQQLSELREQLERGIVKEGDNAPEQLRATQKQLEETLKELEAERQTTDALRLALADVKQQAKAHVQSMREQFRREARQAIEAAAAPYVFSRVKTSNASPCATGTTTQWLNKSSRLRSRSEISGRST